MNEIEINKIKMKKIDMDKIKMKKTKMNKIKIVFLSISMLFLFSVAKPAQAIMISQSDGAGGWTPYTPAAGWQTTPDPLGAAGTQIINNSGNFEVRLGTNSWGAAIGDLQEPAIYGGALILDPAAGYRIDFNAYLNTWDYYVQSNYFDVFAVNLNQMPVGQSGLYWDLVSGGVSNPLIAPDPLGNPIDPNTPGYSNNLPGVTWAWGGGGAGSTGLTIEQLSNPNPNPYSLTLIGDPNLNYVLNVVLDTQLNGWGDVGYPSYGAFNSTPLPAVSPVPEPGTMILLGSGLLGLVMVRKRKTV